MGAWVPKRRALLFRDRDRDAGKPAPLITFFFFSFSLSPLPPFFLLLLPLSTFSPSVTPAALSGARAVSR